MALPRASATALRRPRAALPAAVAFLVSAVLVAGCQSNPEPPPLGSTSTSPSPSPSPTLVAPTLPSEAKGTNKAAAEAFVRHYIASVNYAGSTGDVSHLKELSLDSCESCAGIIRKIDEVYGGGGRIEGRGWSLLVIETVSGQPLREPILQVGVRLSNQRIIAGDGGLTQKFRGGKQPMIFRLSWENGWRVRQLEKVE